MPNLRLRAVELEDTDAIPFPGVRRAGKHWQPHPEWDLPARKAAAEDALDHAQHNLDRLSALLEPNDDDRPRAA
jgi:hypothetical protein